MATSWSSATPSTSTSPRGPSRIAAAAACTLHGLGRGDHHRLRRLPGLLASARERRRRDQGLGHAAATHGAIIEIAEEGVAFRSYLDGTEQFMGLDESMDVQAALGSDIALAFDECTPYPRRLRLHGALHRADPPLARPLPTLARRERARTAGAVRDRPRRRPRGPAARVSGASRGRRDRRDLDRRHARAATRTRCAACSGMTVPHAAPRCPQAPARDRRAGRPAGRDRARHRRLRLRRADRLARHGVALAPLPGSASARPAQRSSERRSRPLVEGCPCPACTRHTRAYLHYLARAEELTAVRLLAPQPDVPGAPRERRATRSRPGASMPIAAAGSSRAPHPGRLSGTPTVSVVADEVLRGLATW